MNAPKTTAGDHLPGDLDRESLIARMIRVDHAGEYGAARIYHGQLAVFGDRPDIGPVIREMADQEQAHLDRFDQLIVERRVRPTALAPVWHVAGFALGVASALAGPKAAMACTAAVEQVIDEHYAAQAARLGDDETELRATINRFREDEIRHRDTALAHDAAEAPAYRPVSAVVKAGTRFAIWLSERV